MEGSQGRAGSGNCMALWQWQARSLRCCVARLFVGCAGASDLICQKLFADLLMATLDKDDKPRKQTLILELY